MSWHGPPFPVEARQPGPDPQRTSYGSFCSFTDPDGTGGGAGRDGPADVTRVGVARGRPGCRGWGLAATATGSPVCGG